MSAARPAFVGGRGGGWGGAGLLGSRLPRRCGCLSRWRVPGVGEPRAADACRGEDIAPPRRMDGCRGRDRFVSCPASWGGLAPTSSAHHPRSRRGPGPTPRARHYEGSFASALSPREKGREDANAFRNVAVCLSVCPSVPHLRLTWSPHNRSQTGREEATRKPAGHTTGDPSVSHAFFSRSLPPPINQSATELPPGGLWWPLRGARPPCGRRRGPCVR